LNRLKSAREVVSAAEQWKQQFSYDRWGNRLIDNAVTYGIGINNKAFTVNSVNNQLGVPSGQSGVLSYDAAGNLTNDTYTGAGNRTYDGENKITSAWGGNNQAQLYDYDAIGQRIKRTVNGVATWQVYGLGGELLAEYAANGAAGTPQKEYGYRNGQLLITASPGSTGGSIATENVVWTGAANVTVNGNSITRSAATSAWDGGANSTRAIVSGNGYVEMTVTETNKDRFFGLSHSETTVSYSDIDFSVRPYSNGVVYCYEPGTNGAFCGYYSPGDKFRVAIEGGVVKYYQISGTQTILMYTATNAPTYPLSADGAIYDSGGTISNVVISGSLSGAGGGGGGASVQWIVSDHLGTPRIIFDQSGALSSTKRHDYLPFGEELFAGTGGRTTTMGYAAGDGVRQQFTQKERDVETGLDYFGARYYASVQGRFTSVDPENFQAIQNRSKPQSWNGYSYVNNNPLRSTDPTGLGEASEPDVVQRFRNWWNYGYWLTDAELHAAAEAARQQIAAEFRYKDPDTGEVGPIPIEGRSDVDVLLIRDQLVKIREEGNTQTWDPPEPVVGSPIGTTAPQSKLTNAQRAKVDKIDRIIQDHLTDRDIQGLTRDVSRNPVPKPRGGSWDHFKEVTEAVKGLKREIQGLNRSLRNPNLDPAARTEIQQAIDKAQNYVTRVENIIRSH
jgi:RHS repeat-associated protein